MATEQNLIYRVSVNDAALDRLIAKTNLLGRSFIGSGNALKPLDVQLRALGRRATEVGRYFTRNFTTPMVIAGAAAVKLGYDFEKSFGRIETLAGASTKEMKTFKKEVYDLGRTTPTSVNDLAKALYFIRSSGFAGAEALKVLTASNDAAIAGLADVQTNADVVTSALNAYGHAALTASEATDILLATVRVGKAEPEELARSIGRVIPLAAQLGVEFREVGGAIAATTLQGLSADLAVTGLRAIFVTFTKALKPTREALLALGFSFEQIQASIEKQGLQPTLNRLRVEVDKFAKRGGVVSKETFAALTKGGVDAAKAQRILTKDLGTTASTILSKLFPNVRALTSFLILTARNGKASAQAVGEVNAAMGETAKRKAAAEAQPWFKLALALNRVRTEATALGEAIEPAAERLANFAATLFGAFNKLPPFIKQFVGMNALLLAGLGPVLIGVGQLIRLSTLRVLRTSSGAAEISKAYDVERGMVATTGTAATSAGVAATKASSQTVVGADLATAAYARESAAVRALAGEEANRARIATLAQLRGGGAAGTTLIGGGRPLYRQGAFGGAERGPAGRVMPGIKGPGGMPMFFPPGSSEQMARATTKATVLARAVGRSRAAFIGLRAGIAGAAGALSGFLAIAWPLIAIEGAILLWQNWDKVSGAITNAESAVHDFTKSIPVVGKVVEAWDALPKGAKQAAKLAVSPWILLAERSTAKRAEHAKKAAEEAKKEAAELKKLPVYVRQIAQLTGLSPEKAKELAEQLHLGAQESGKIGANLQKAQSAIQGAFGRLGEDFDTLFQAATDNMLSRFDAATERIVENLKATVRVAGRTFTIRTGQKTPAEREADALEKSVRLLRLRNDLMDAGRAIIAATALGSPTALREAQQAAAEARAGIRGERLGSRAERERRAANKALTEEERRVRARRDRQRKELVGERALQQRHMQDQLATLEKQLENGKITVAQFNKRLREIMGKYGLTMTAASRLLGKAFAKGLQESLNSVRATVKRYAGALGLIALAAEQARKRFQAANRGMVHSVTSAADGIVKQVHRIVKAIGGVSEKPLKLSGPFPGVPSFNPRIPQPGQPGGPAGPPTPRKQSAAQFLRNRALRYISGGVSLSDTAKLLQKQHPKYTLKQIERIIYGPTRSFQTGGMVPGYGPQMIVAHGGETVTPRGKMPKWLLEERRRTIRLIARQDVRHSRMERAAARGKHFTARQVYGTMVPQLQKTLSREQKARLGGGQEAYLNQLAMTASSPIAAGLIRTRPGKSDILGPGGRSGRARPITTLMGDRPVGNQTITINITEARDPRKTAAAVRRELQKHSARNASKPRGRHANETLGLK